MSLWKLRKGSPITAYMVDWIHKNNPLSFKHSRLLYSNSMCLEIGVIFSKHWREIIIDLEFYSKVNCHSKFKKNLNIFRLTKTIFYSEILAKEANKKYSQKIRSEIKGVSYKNQWWII